MKNSNERPFKIPDDYFNDFEKVLKPHLNIPQGKAFRTPTGYQEKLTKVILSETVADKRRTPVFRWLSIAAAFILPIAIVGSIFLSQDKTDSSMAVSQEEAIIYLTQNAEDLSLTELVELSILLESSPETLYEPTDTEEADELLESMMEDLELDDLDILL